MAKGAMRLHHGTSLPPSARKKSATVDDRDVVAESSDLGSSDRGEDRCVWSAHVCPHPARMSHDDGHPRIAKLVREVLASHVERRLRHA
jgi:hypothetical protein